VSAVVASSFSSFFDSSAWTAIVRLLAFFVFVLYVSLAFWVHKDAKRRITDPWLVGVAVATAVLFPFVGALIYAILRPPEYLQDVRERELEIRAMESRLGANLHCPYCHLPVESNFLVCPYCATRLKIACRRCSSPLEPGWRVCPHCETSVQPSGETVEIS